MAKNDLFKPEEYKVTNKKVKILRGKNQEQLMKQLEELEREYIILDVKQHTANMMFVFYTE